jgi:regulator of replication initiation timing
MMTKLRIENLHLREKLANAEKRAQVNTPTFQNYDHFDLLE